MHRFTNMVLTCSLLSSGLKFIGFNWLGLPLPPGLHCSQIDSEANMLSAELALEYHYTSKHISVDAKNFFIDEA